MFIKKIKILFYIWILINNLKNKNFIETKYALKYKLTKNIVKIIYDIKKLKCQNNYELISNAFFILFIYLN